MPPFSSRRWMRPLRVQLVASPRRGVREEPVGGTDKGTPTPSQSATPLREVSAAGSAAGDPAAGQSPPPPSSTRLTLQFILPPTRPSGQWPAAGCASVAVLLVEDRPPPPKRSVGPPPLPPSPPRSVATASSCAAGVGRAATAAVRSRGPVQGAGGEHEEIADGAGGARCSSGCSFQNRE